MNWLKDNLGLFHNFKELKQLYHSVENNGGIYFVTGFSGLFSPHWDDSVRGLIVGITSHTQKGHIIRSAFNAISLRSLEIVECFEKDSHLKLKSLRVDGGMVQSDEFLQTQANILNAHVHKPSQFEMTVLGSAIVAGLSKEAGLWKDFNEIQKIIKIDKVFKPQWEPEYRDHVIQKWNLAVEKSKNWIPANPKF